MRQVLKDKNKKLLLTAATCFLLLLLSFPGLKLNTASAAPIECVEASCASSPGAGSNNNQESGQKYCGDGDQKVKISLDIGCRGEGGGIMNPITDAIFAIIRFLSLGVGLIIVGSITFAGIQYTSSRGDPKATADAITRIKSNVIAFLIYVFSFAILNYLIPKGFIG